MFNAGDHVPVIPLVEVVGKALKAAPEQIGPTWVKVGVTLELTVIVKPELVAGEPVKHGEAFEVIIQAITSVFTKSVPETPV